MIIVVTQRLSSGSCAVSRPPFSSLSWFTYCSGICKWNGVLRPMKLAMRPMKAVQLVVSAFQSGEVACRCLMYAKTFFASSSLKIDAVTCS